jgi:hypothetical protein
MDHPCHKCGNSVEDGKAFCSQCGAPQIRVPVPELSVQTVTGSVSSSDPSVFPLDPPIVSGTLSPPALSTAIRWPTAFRACAIAALIAFLVTALRLMVPPLAVLGAGFLAVILYRRRNPTWSINAGSGAQLGAVSGLLFSGISAIFAALALALLQAGGQVRQAMLDALQQLAARSNDPQVQAALDLLKSQEGLASKLLSGMVVLVLVSIAAGCIAGAITGAFLSRKNRP